MQDLRQSTASQIISLGQFLDSTDGDSEENGLTINNTDIKIRKNGATTLANKSSGGATNISNGVYHATLNATDSNTLGRLEIYVHVAGALAVKATFRVLTATAFDAIYAGTFNNLGGTAQSADNDTKISLIPTTPMRGTENAATATNLATLDGKVVDLQGSGFNTSTDSNEAIRNRGDAEWVTATGFNVVVPDPAGVVPTLAEMVDGVWDELKSAHTTPNSFGDFLDVEVSSVSGGGGLTQQNVRDSMELAPTAGTPATDSIDDKLDTVIATQENQNPVEQARTSDVVTTGTQTGTSANTLLQDGTLWTLTSVAGGIDAELIFNIGTDSEIPSSLSMVAFFDSGKGRSLQIQAFNFNQNAFENRGGVQNNSSSLNDITLGLTDSHVKRGQAGTPGVDGDVRIRFLYDLTVSGKVSAGDDWNIDVTHVNWIKAGTTLGDFLDVLSNSNPQRNYPLAAITIDTENGAPGTKVGTNGTPGNASNNLVDARILADALGFNRYVLEGFTTLLTLDQNYDNWQFVSVVFGGTVNGNGQSTDGAVFLNMQLEGVFVGEIDCTQCSLKGLTTEGFFQLCTLPQNPSVTLTGNSNFRDCDSTLPGVGNPGIDANNVVGLSLSFTKYAGGLDLSNLDDAANVTVSGRGSLALTDAATTATVIVSGHMRLTGSLPTGIALTDDARIDTGQLDTALIGYGANTVTPLTFDQIWTTQLTESYASDGVAPTPAQALFITMQNLQDFSNAGTTQTVRRIDGTSTAATYTYDDGTNPTSKTRTS